MHICIRVLSNHFYIGYSGSWVRAKALMHHCHLMDALDLNAVGPAVACCVPLEVFRCRCVSAGWKKRGSPVVFLPFFDLDLSDRALAVRDVAAIATSIPDGATSLRFKLTRSGDAGAQAVAERIPEGLTSLSLSFHRNGHSLGLPWNLDDREEFPLAARVVAPGTPSFLDLIDCNIGNAGLRAVAERIPTGLTSLDLDFGLTLTPSSIGGAIGDAGAFALAERMPPGFKTKMLKKNHSSAKNGEYIFSTNC